MTIAEKLTTIAENRQKIYNKGVTDGKQAEYDAFWDAYQLNGNRSSYEAAFAGQGWNDKTFNPKYPIVVTGSSWNMFYSCNVKDGYEHLKNMDFSKCTLLSNTFAQCHMKHLGTIDCRNVKSVSQVFYHARNLQTIDKIIVKVENTFSSLFDNIPTLENVTFEGEIGNNLVMAGTYSGTKWGEKLTRASIESIITHLSDSASGKTLTLSKAAVDEAFKFVVEMTDGTLYTSWGTDGDNPYWWPLRNTKLNWEIVYS